MKIYDYSKTKNCIICGSIDGDINKFIKKVVGGLDDLRSYKTEIHPKELERLKKNEDSTRPFRRFRDKCESDSANLTNSIVIVNGFNGFGQRDLKYYHDKLYMLNRILADNNTHILFVRGNDDPKYFKEELINLSNIKTIQDYSVVKLNKYNCLCIGGCVSIDRSWRMEQQKRICRNMYWEGEKLQYNKDDIDKILKDYNIACVITASCPSFANPSMNSFKHSVWVNKDENLIKDMTEERIIMDKIYSDIMKSNGKPYMWIYSRFKFSNRTMMNDIIFQSLNTFQFLSFNYTLSMVFNVNFSKMLKKNEYVYDQNPNLDDLNPFVCNIDVENINVDVLEGENENGMEELDGVEGENENGMGELDGVNDEVFHRIFRNANAYRRRAVEFQNLNYNNIVGHPIIVPSATATTSTNFL